MKNLQNYTFKNVSKIYSPSQINEVLQEYLKDKVKVIGTNKKISYLNAPIAFDIETTSFEYRGEKRAIMYEWTLGINGAVIIGRTWDEFLFVYHSFCEVMETDIFNRAIWYVHNLGFEFQFLRKYLEWESVFSVAERKPLKALTAEGVEFRCSLQLSGKSLAKVGEDLRKYPCSKMVGDLDYSLMRHSRTPLSYQEMKYCENDVRVVMSFIQEELENNGDITKIPLTKTGYVRRYCRNACLYPAKSHKKGGKKYGQYRSLIAALTITTDEYKQLKRAFQGGFTHANAWSVGKVHEDVASFDFTSSYPAVMVAEKFPMSRAELVEINSGEEFKKNLALYCCLFDVKFTGLESCQMIDHPLSRSRCAYVKNIVEDNGRVVKADELVTTLTEQDYYIIQKFYTWHKIEIGTFRRYKRGYLPHDFIDAVLKLYEDKTALKGVAGKEIEYMLAKGMLNSCYGMTVTDICRDEVTYKKGEWGLDPVDEEKQIQKYNLSKSRFMFFPWGVWVTAYARRNLFTGIKAFGYDYIYSDTDSIKAINKDAHMDYINIYNHWITERLEAAAEFQGFSIERIKPKTIKGVEKPLGVWDYEGSYKKFKTLGAKRYMTEDEKGEVSLTVAGLNKKTAAPYLKEKYVDVFEAFNNNLYIPKEFTGKNTHSYIDYEVKGIMEDYTGIKAEYSQLTGVHLEGSDYSLSLSKAYLNYLEGITE